MPSAISAVMSTHSLAGGTGSSILLLTESYWCSGRFLSLFYPVIRNIVLFWKSSSWWLNSEGQTPPWSGPVTCADIKLDDVVFFCNNNVTIAISYWMLLTCHRWWSKLYTHYGLLRFNIWKFNNHSGNYSLWQQIYKVSIIIVGFFFLFYK